MKISYVLPALLSVALAAPHINYYSDIGCKNWIGQLDIGLGWGEQTFASPNGAHGVVAVDTDTIYHIEFYNNDKPEVKFPFNPGKCYNTTGSPITHITPW